MIYVKLLNYYIVFIEKTLDLALPSFRQTYNKTALYLAGLEWNSAESFAIVLVKSKWEVRNSRVS